MHIADALDHAHEQGVLHRDIKPSNLMLDAAGKAWITDFGLARIDSAASLTHTGDLLGTLRYMSPEQALAKRVPIDHRSDIYSLGITLYELLTLQPAFESENRAELLRQVAFEEPTPPRKIDPRIPLDLETILLKAIEKNPAERYQTAAELAADLQAFVEQRAIRARPPTLGQRFTRWSLRHRRALASAAAMLTMTCLGLGVALAVILRQNSALATALDDTTIARDRADKNWQQTLTLLNDTRELLSAPDADLSTIIPRLLVQQQRHVATMANVNEGMPELLYELVRTSNNAVGVSPIAEQKEALDRTLALAERLMALAPHDERNQSAYALTLDLNSTQWTVHRLDDQPRRDLFKGLKVNQENIHRLRQHLARLSESPVLQTALARALYNRYAFLLDLSDHAQAQDVEMARTEWLGYVLANLTSAPTDAQARRDYVQQLFFAAQNLALITNRSTDAETLLWRVIKASDLLPAKDQIPDSPPMFMRSYEILIDLLQAQGRTAEARAILPAAEKRLRALFAEVPKSANQAYRPNAVMRCAMQLDRLGLKDEAFECRAWALELANREFDSQLTSLRPHVHSGSSDWIATSQSQVLANRGALHESVAIARRGWQDAELLEASRPESRQSPRQALGEKTPPVSRDYLVASRAQLIHSRLLCESRAATPNSPKLRDQILASPKGPMSPLLLGFMLEWGSPYEWSHTENAVAWRLATNPKSEQRDPVLACHLVQAAIDRSPGEAGFWSTLGVAQYRAGQWKNAVATLEKSVEKSGGESPIDFLFLAMSYWRLGDKERANSDFRRSNELVAARKRQHDEELIRFREEAAELLGNRE